ncbi:MAG: methylenetetrahydrofolate reductase C-terminal domain-containing protein [Dehalococcoidia bacterium]|nr:methylenetetrahydrofolate reductase C-terminal domain-containing protein [Dehalococcoidia bacterium]
MLISEQKPMEEILGYLNGDRSVFLLGCDGCAQASHTGGPEEVREMQGRLEAAGKTVTGSTVLDFLCERAQVKLGLVPFAGQVAAADSVLVMSCGVGIQAAAASIDKPVHPACNTLSLGGSRGEWQGSERCMECGDCVLEWTGGICPLTACTKSLLNGQCGGAKNGKCEFQPDLRDCGWHLIYERLRKLNRLQLLRDAPINIKQYSRMQPPKEIRNTPRWSLDVRA